MDSGFVVDTRVCSNFCHVCQTVGKKKEKGEEFNKWKEKHSAVCQKNFNGSANAMEVECAEVNFKRSEERRGLIYNGMLSDGDSKANTHLNEIDVYSGIPVVKEDCVNHVAKRMYTALEKIMKNSVGTAQTLNRKLTQAIMKEVSGSSYASNLKRGALDPVKMKECVYGGYFHVCSLLMTSHTMQLVRRLGAASTEERHWDNHQNHTNLPLH